MISLQSGECARAMDAVDKGQYERIRIKRAKRLAVGFLSHLDAVATQGPDEAELVRWIRS